jgi:hypothetical protein
MVNYHGWNRLITQVVTQVQEGHHLKWCINKYMELFHPNLL